MTARHTDRRCELRQNVKRCHNRNRSREALQISAKTVGFDLLCGDHDENHNSPGRLSGKICCRTSKSDQADQVRDNAGREKRRHKRNQIAEFFSHVADDKFVCGFHNHFCHRLAFGDVPYLQISCEPDAKSGNECHYNPAYHQRFADLNFPEQRKIDRDRKKDFCTGDINLHSLFSPPLYEIK